MKVLTFTKLMGTETCDKAIRGRLLRFYVLLVRAALGTSISSRAVFYNCSARSDGLPIFRIGCALKYPSCRLTRQAVALSNEV